MCPKSSKMNARKDYKVGPKLQSSIVFLRFLQLHESVMVLHISSIHSTCYKFLLDLVFLFTRPRSSLACEHNSS